MSGIRRTSGPPLIHVEHLAKNYYLGRSIVQALRGVYLEVRQG